MHAAKVKLVAAGVARTTGRSTDVFGDAYPVQGCGWWMIASRQTRVLNAAPEGPDCDDHSLEKKTPSVSSSMRCHLLASMP